MTAAPIGVVPQAMSPPPRPFRYNGPLSPRLHRCSPQDLHSKLIGLGTQPLAFVCILLPMIDSMLPPLHITRYSDHHNLDPAVYPYFEIYPKIQTAQPRILVKSGDHTDVRRVEACTPLGPNVLETQPWTFVWPSFRSDPPLAPTPSSAPSLVSSLALGSTMAYPVIKICKLSHVGIVHLNLD